MSPKKGNGNGWHISALGTIVAGFGILTALILGLAYAPNGMNERTTPIVVSIIGLVASTVPSIIAMYKAEQASNTASDIHDDMKNGMLKNKVKDAIYEVELEHDQPKTIKRPETKP